MKNFALSIVTGTLNRKKHLENLIDSIKNFPDIQLVLVDGGSTDGTKEFLQSLNSFQVKSIFFKVLINLS